MKTLIYHNPFDNLFRAYTITDSMLTHLDKYKRITIGSYTLSDDIDGYEYRSLIIKFSNLLLLSYNSFITYPVIESFLTAINNLKLKPHQLPTLLQTHPELFI